MLVIKLYVRTDATIFLPIEKELLVMCSNKKDNVNNVIKVYSPIYPCHFQACLHAYLTISKSKASCLYMTVLVKEFKP